MPNHNNYTGVSPTMNTAHDYCKTIATELNVLAHVAEQWNIEDPEEWDSETRSWADDLSYNPDSDDMPDVGARYVEDALDVYSVLHHRWDQQLSVDRVVLLRTCGGPHCEIVWDGDDMLTVQVWWGGEESTRRVECSPVADALALIAEMAEENIRS
jgi:hypothetical protein